MALENELLKIKEKLSKEENSNVRVALFGQPGAGKSSILNKLIGNHVAVTGQRTDVTVKEEVYDWNGIHLVDLPGFGTKQFPKEGYFEKFKIETFDLFLCVFSGKFHQPDSEFFKEIKSRDKVCLFVRNKHDEIWEEGRELSELEEEILTDVKKQVNAEDINVVFTSCRLNYGFDALQNLILENLEPAKRERWARGAKAYSVEFLENKRTACKKYVYIAAGAAAANALNPIPGADIAVDLSVIATLFSSIRSSYGLTNEKLKSVEIALPTVAPLANNIVKYAAKEGAIMLLKKFIGRQAVKQVSKYIPFVGQAVAASAGFAITTAAGVSYLNDCHEVAKKVLENDLSRGK
ncbi:MAG: GTPase [Bacteroidota bacterium]|jgi:small GTP-binding protein